jgi:hypothetical protein
LPIAADLAATTAAAASINSAAVLFSRAGAGHFSRAPKIIAHRHTIERLRLLSGHGLPSITLSPSLKEEPVPPSEEEGVMTAELELARHRGYQFVFGSYDDLQGNADFQSCVGVLTIGDSRPHIPAEIEKARLFGFLPEDVRHIFDKDSAPLINTIAEQTHASALRRLPLLGHPSTHFVFVHVGATPAGFKWRQIVIDKGGRPEEQKTLTRRLILQLLYFDLGMSGPALAIWLLRQADFLARGLPHTTLVGEFYRSCVSKMPSEQFAEVLGDHGTAWKRAADLAGLHEARILEDPMPRGGTRRILVRPDVPDDYATNLLNRIGDLIVAFDDYREAPPLCRVCHASAAHCASPEEHEARATQRGDEWLLKREDDRDLYDRLNAKRLQWAP